MTHDRRNRTTKSRKNQNAWGKGNLQVLGNIGSGHHRACGDKRKTLKRVSLKNEETAGNHTKQKISYQRINTLTVPLVRYSELFLKWTR